MCEWLEAVAAKGDEPKASDEVRIAMRPLLWFIRPSLVGRRNCDLHSVLSKTGTDPRDAPKLCCLLSLSPGGLIHT